MYVFKLEPGYHPAFNQKEVIFDSTKRAWYWIEYLERYSPRYFKLQSDYEYLKYRLVFHDEDYGYVCAVQPKHILSFLNYRKGIEND
jgi:hypothetical protein